MTKTFTRLLARGGYRWGPFLSITLLLTILITASTKAQYCGAGGGEFANCDPSVSDEFIVNVTLNGVSNPSGCSPWIPDSGYTDYSASVIFSVTSCSAYTVEIENSTTNWADDRGKVWVDWNNDFDFDDAGEFIGSQAGTVGTYMITLSVPGSVPTGDYRMRTRIDYNTAGVNPCGYTSFGEVEDYTLSVTNTGGCLCTGPVTSTQTLTTADFVWASIPSAQSYNVRYKAVSDPTTVPTWATPTNVTDTTFNITGLDTCTAYEFQIQVVCVGGDTSSYSATYTFATFCCFDPIPLATYIEAEACGADVNGGCNTTGTFEAVACGGVIAGTAWYDGNFTLDNDWYEFTVTQDTFVSLFLQSAYMSQMYLYDAAAGCFSTAMGQGFTDTDCDTFSFGMNLAPGTYQIQVLPQYTFIANNCGSGSNAYLLNISCAAPLPGPVNDDCDSAIVLIQDTTCNYQTFNVNAASQSQFGCAGTANDDVWFSFVATTAEPVISVLGSASFDPVFEVFDACGGLSLSCVDNTGTAGEETTQLTGLTIGNTYYVRVYDYFAGFPATTDFQICISEPFQYCQPSVAICDEYIQNVELNGTSNLTDCTVGGYTDYSSTVNFDVVAGGCQQLVVTVGNFFSSSDGISVYIDWNNDLDFTDPGEEVYQQVSGTPVMNANLNIPGSTTPGTYHMRVFLYYFAGFGDPCYNGTFGEAEDYSITVGAGGSCVGSGLLALQSQSMTTATVAWGAAPVATTYNVRYKLVSDPTTVPTWATPTVVTDTLIALVGLDSCAQYEIEVQADCGGGDTSTWSCTFTFGTTCCIDATATANHIEAEACGDDTNGGCNMVTPNYEPIVCGDNVAGTGWWDGSNRDTDWFLLSLPTDTNVTLTLTAAFTSTIFILDPLNGCGAAPNYIANAAGPCDTASLSVNLPAGDWWVFVAPQFTFETYPCGSGQNNYLLTLDCQAPLPVPANDTCGGAIEVFCGDTISGSTFTASFDNTAPACNYTVDAPGVWYSIVGDNSLVTLSLCNGTTYDSKIHVYTGDCTALTCVTDDDDFCGFAGPSQVSFTAQTGVTYYILVNGYIGSLGDFVFTVQCDTPPANDFVCGALPLNFGVNGPFNTAVAGTEIGEPVPPANGCTDPMGWCNDFLTNSLWFTFVAPASGNIIVQSPDFDTQLAVWSADSCQGILNGSAVLVGANDDDLDPFAHGGQTYSSYLPLTCLTPGQTYYVQLDPYASPGQSTTIVVTDPGLSSSDPSFTGLAASYCFTAAPVTLTPTTPGGTFSGPGINGDMFEPATTGVGGPYAIVYSLSACSADTQYVNVTQLSLTTDVTQPGCGVSNGAIDLTVVDGVAPFSYTWVPGFSADEDLFGLAPGTYDVTVVDASGCSGTTSVTLVNGGLTLTPNVVDVDCNGAATGAINLVVGSAGAYTVSWSNGATTDTISGLTAGDYEVTVDDGAGCSVVDTFTVSEPAATTLTFNEDAPVVCAGDNTGAVTVTAVGIAPFQYAWSNGSTDATANGLVEGAHTVTVTDANGCTTVGTTTLTALSPTIVLTETHVDAIGGLVGSIDLTVNGGSAPFAYLWSNAATTEDLNGLDVGTYDVTVTDANGCTSTLSVTINDAPPMIVTLIPIGPVTSCHMAFNVTLTATSYPNTIYTFRRGTLGAGAPVVQTGPSNTFQPNTPGTHNYVVIAENTVTGQKDTSDYVTVTLNVLPIPAVVAGTCNGGEVTLTGTPTDASYTYQWIADLTDIAGATNATYVATQQGAYRFKVTDSCGVVKISDPVWFPEDCFVDGIEDITLNTNGAGVNVYPNPNDGQFTVETYVPEAGNEKVQIEVFNVLGQSVHEQSMQLVNGYAKANLAIAKTFADGMYTVRVVSSRGEASVSMIVTH